MIPMSVSIFKRVQSALTKGRNMGRNALLRRLIAPVSLPLDTLLHRKQALPGAVPPCVIICSPPRSGSTVIYQVLARVLQCSTITNLHQLAPRHATGLLQAKSKTLPPPTKLNSFYGHTASLSDVSEGNEMVRYWFKTSDEREIRHRFIETMGWLKVSKEYPAIIKNVGIYDKISRLHAAVPEIAVVRLRRNTQSVVESELRGYRELGSINPIPDGMDEKAFDNPIELVVNQILRIEKRLDEEIARIPTDRQLAWTYEAFLSTPEEKVKQLSAFINVDADWEKLDTALHPSSRRNVDDEGTREIARLIAGARL